MRAVRRRLSTLLGLALASTGWAATCSDDPPNKGNRWDTETCASSKDWLVAEETFVCRENNKWVNKGYCEQTCYDLGKEYGYGLPTDAGARFIYKDCGREANSDEEIAALAAADALDGTIIFKLAPSENEQEQDATVGALSAAFECDAYGEPEKLLHYQDRELAEELGLDLIYGISCIGENTPNSEIGPIMMDAFAKFNSMKETDDEILNRVESVNAGLKVTNWDDAAVDDPDWRFRNKANRGCDWVGKKLFRRCQKRGAEEACADTCATDDNGLRTTLSDTYYKQDKQSNLETARVVGAWAETTGSAGIVVQVIDSGLDLSHEEHQDNIWTNDGEICGNGEDDDGNGFIDDCHGYNFADSTGEDLLGGSSHGTFCSGIIAGARNNEKGIAGIVGGDFGRGSDDGARSGARLMTGVLFGKTGNRGMADAIVYGADMGARISSNSWGYSTPGFMSADLRAAIDYAVAKGVVVVFAAGNSARNGEYYPGFYSKVVAVAATDNDDAITSFSNYGPWIDVAAPGKGLVSTKIGASSYGSASGTSFSCPTVSGVLAMGFSKYPAATADDARACLTVSAGGARDISGKNPLYAPDALGADGGALDAEGFLNCLKLTQQDAPDPTPAPVPEPTPRPTRAPTPEPSQSAENVGNCFDDPTWKHARRGVAIDAKNCAWIADRGATPDRCAKKSLAGVAASDACACACADV